MLEVSHFHLFAMGMLLLVLTHLMLFVPLADRREGVARRAPLRLGALDEGAAGWCASATRPSRC